MYIYDQENRLVGEFSSQIAAAEWLGVSTFTVSKYIKSGKEFFFGRFFCLDRKA